MMTTEYHSQNVQFDHWAGRRTKNNNRPTDWNTMIFLIENKMQHNRGSSEFLYFQHESPALICPGQSGWFTAWAFWKESSLRSSWLIRIMVGNCPKSGLKRFALHTCGTRDMSAKVTVSPTQYLPAVAWRRISRAWKPSIQTNSQISFSRRQTEKKSHLH